MDIFKGTALCGIAVSMTFGVPGFGSTIRDDQRDSAYQALAASADFASVGSILGSGFYNFIGLSYWNAELGENMQ